jgi:hypothetical protein
MSCYSVPRVVVLLGSSVLPFVVMVCPTVGLSGYTLLSAICPLCPIYSLVPNTLILWCMYLCYVLVLLLLLLLVSCDVIPFHVMLCYSVGEVFRSTWCCI